MPTGDFKKILSDFNAALAAVRSLSDIEAIAVAFFGKKGTLTEAMKVLPSLGGEDRRKKGEEANQAKHAMTKLLEQRRLALILQKEQTALTRETIDITEPPLPVRQAGHAHPIVELRMELQDMFMALGFSVLDGPELESDFFNFEALNIPRHHPARDTQDTFYIGDAEAQLMRTHTSSVQVRAMLKYGAPLAAVAAGRVYRNEATDVSHEHTFDQLEGFMVDKNISIRHLIAVMQKVVEGVFHKQVEIRLRPGHFNFVEPGFEMDIQCMRCGGTGCPFCKMTGWVETVGCGLIHPRVLEHGKIDPRVYSGFAFGFGLTRLAVMRYGIEDIRLFASGNFHFLNQF